MEADRSSVARAFRETRDRWPLMTAYERFEQVIALALSFIVAVVIVIALIQLVIRVLPLLIGGAVDIGSVPIAVEIQGAPSAVR